MTTTQVLAAEPGEWGIVGVASHNLAVVNVLREQDGVYLILELTPEDESVSVADVHCDLVVVAEEAEWVLDLLAEPRHRIVILAVSENGYHRDSRTGDLDHSGPAIPADFTGGARATMGLIARGLVRRSEHGGTPVTVLSCNSMVSAGDITHSLVVELPEEIDVGPEFFA